MSEVEQPVFEDEDFIYPQTYFCTLSEIICMILYKEGNLMCFLQRSLCTRTNFIILRYINNQHF